MVDVIIFAIVYVYTSIVWVFVLVVYNLLVESFDFGPLGAFAWKSAILIFLVTLVIIYVPLGMFASLLLWFIGLLVVLKKDAWESRVLVIMIWGSYIVVSLLMDLMIRSMFTAAAG